MNKLRLNKFKFFINFDKEEKWLNEMAKHGWEMVGKFGYYMFQQAEPKDTIIKVDYRSFNTRDAYNDYLTLFKDSGWEHIAGSKNSGSQYFKNINKNSDAEIFSDEASKAARYKRLSSMWRSLAITYVPILIALVTTKAIDTTMMLHPKLLYLTPGLWDMSGLSFWKAFLFETPFAIARGFIWLIFPILIILYFAFAIKAELYYRKTSC